MTGPGISVMMGGCCDGMPGSMPPGSYGMGGADSNGRSEGVVEPEPSLGGATERGGGVGRADGGRSDRTSGGRADGGAGVAICGDVERRPTFGGAEVEGPRAEAGGGCVAALGNIDLGGGPESLPGRIDVAQRMQPSASFGS
jgi:hypothetical protein